MRDLARRELEAAGETMATTWRYTTYGVQVAQETQAQYLTGGDCAQAALARFDTENPHLEAAHAWAATHVGNPAGDQLNVAGV